MHSSVRAKQSQETCTNAASSFERLAQRVFRPKWEFCLSRKIPSPACCVLRKGRGGGILIFSLKNLSLCRLCGPLCLGGDPFSKDIHHRDTERSQRGTERITSRTFFSRSLGKLALLLIIATLIASSASCSRQHGQNSSSITE